MRSKLAKWSLILLCFAAHSLYQVAPQTIDSSNGLHINTLRMFLPWKENRRVKLFPSAGFPKRSRLDTNLE